MNIFFGTDGWRAYVDSEINEKTVAIVAQAFADFLKSKNESSKVAISYDTRRQSDVFAKVFSEVLSGNNIEVLLSDRITPTPILSYATKNLACTAGVMITASHNPPAYNGIKFKSELGGPFNSDHTKEVEKYLRKSEIKSSPSLVKLTNFTPAYVEHISKLIDFSLIKKLQHPILIDSMGGAGKNLLEEILTSQGCKASTIFGDASETFNGRLAEPIEKNLAPLMQTLKEKQFSFGVATDGDADRLGVCLDTGEWLSAQNTILLLVDYVKRVKGLSGGIVKTSSVTDKLRMLYESPKTPVYEVQVGFKYIADVMIANDVAFGGEESGGFGYGIHIPERDGIFSALLMLEMLAHSTYQKLSDYLKERQETIGEIFYDRIDAHYNRADKNDLLPFLAKNMIDSLGNFNLKSALSYQSSRDIVNGMKFIFDGGCRWLLIRCSETESMIRYYAEGQSNEEVKELLKLGEKLLDDISNQITANK